LLWEFSFWITALQVRLPKGGHFAAWEQPKLFSEEVRAGFIAEVGFFTREEEMRHA